jgi:hypothetical protein
MAAPLLALGRVNSPAIHPEKRAPGHAAKAAVEHRRDVTIDLSGLGDPVKIEAYKEMKSLAEKFGFFLKVREEIETLAKLAAQAA